MSICQFLKFLILGFIILHDHNMNFSRWNNSVIILLKKADFTICLFFPDQSSLVQHKNHKIAKNYFCLQPMRNSIPLETGISWFYNLHFFSQCTAISLNSYNTTWYLRDKEKIILSSAKATILGLINWKSWLYNLYLFQCTATSRLSYNTRITTVLRMPNSSSWKQFCSTVAFQVILRRCHASNPDYG